MNTYIHEQIHVFQRKNIDKFHDLYTNYGILNMLN